jgi:hypothetical protein
MSKTLIVTGAAKGIGAGVTKTFLERGYNVVANSRDFTNSGFAATEKLALVEGDIGKASTAAKAADIAKIAPSSTGTPSGSLYSQHPGAPKSCLRGKPREEVPKQRRHFSPDRHLRCCDIDTEPHDARHLVQRSEVLPRHREHVQSRSIRRPCCFAGVQLLSHAAHKLRFMAA